MEVAFAFKLSEMKDVIQSLQDDSDKTRQELKNFENMQENTDSKINSLQVSFCPLINLLFVAFVCSGHGLGWFLICCPGYDVFFL